MLNFFRIISLTEGCSYLLILCVSLGFIGRDFVSALGMAHGVLFIVYCLLALIMTRQKSWSLRALLFLFLSALIPFAFIPVELFLRKQQ